MRRIVFLGEREMILVPQRLPELLKFLFGERPIMFFLPTAGHRKEDITFVFSSPILPVRYAEGIMEKNFELQRKGHHVTQWVRENEHQCLIGVDDVIMHGTDAMDLAAGKTTLEKIVASYGGKKIPPSPFDQLSQEPVSNGLLAR